MGSSRGYSPAFDQLSAQKNQHGGATHLAFNPLHVMRTLRITVPSPVLRTRLIRPAHPAIRRHLNEIQRPVQPTHQLRHIHIKCKLLAQEVKHLVLRVILHEIHPRTDVLPELMSRHEFQRKTAPRGGNPVCRLVIYTLDLAVLSASLGIGAGRGIPRIPVVAVLVIPLLVGPAPVGIKHDFAVDIRAAGGCAPLPGE